MGYELRNPEQAAESIKLLATSFNSFGWFRDITVRVRQTPFMCVVTFMHQDWTVASFSLIEQPNCCGVLISTKTYVSDKYRNEGIAQAMMPLKEAIAKQFGYSCLAATVNMTGNPAEVHILEKFGWAKGWEFTNRRTKNQVGFFFKNLEA